MQAYTQDIFIVNGADVEYTEKITFPCSVMLFWSIYIKNPRIWRKNSDQSLLPISQLD